MTELEIVRDYQTAKYPKEQIKILAELNDTSTVEIRRVLQKHGALKTPQKPKRKLSFDEDTALDMYYRDYTDKDIGAALGVPLATITSWRQRRGLKGVSHVSFDERAAMDLYKQAYTDKNIADVIGVSKSTIRRWRFQRGLRPNRNARAPNRKERNHDNQS